MLADPIAVAREHNGDVELRDPSAIATEHGDAASAVAAPSVTATEKENYKENEKEKEECTDAAPPASLGEKEHILPTHGDKDERCGNCGTVHHQTRRHTTNYVCHCEHCGHDHWIGDDCPVQDDYPER